MRHNFHKNKVKISDYELIIIEKYIVCFKYNYVTQAHLTITQNILIIGHTNLYLLHELKKVECRGACADERK